MIIHKSNLHKEIRGWVFSPSLNEIMLFTNCTIAIITNTTTAIIDITLPSFHHGINMSLIKFWTFKKRELNSVYIRKKTHPLRCAFFFSVHLTVSRLIWYIHISQKPFLRSLDHTAKIALLTL